MKILKINQQRPDNKMLILVAEALRNEQVIVHPTETVYALAGIFLSEIVISKIISIKQRTPDKPFSIMVNSVEEMLEISGNDHAWLESYLKAIFPDAITVLLPRNRNLENPFWNQFPLLGFRYPRHNLSNLIAARIGQGIITTSANRAQLPPPTRIEELDPTISRQVSLILDGGETQFKIPSTIIEVDIQNQSVKCIREGAVPFKRIQNYFKS
ncbi:MAG: hypothetical protein Kow0042_22540 [Calditrichia bacterium]